MFNHLNVWSWLRDLRLTVRSSIPICLFFNNVFDTLLYVTFQSEEKLLPVSKKKYILRSVPTTLLFSLLFSVAGTLPHLLSPEDHLSQTEVVPSKTSWLRLASFLPAHLWSQIKVFCILHYIVSLKNTPQHETQEWYWKVCKYSFEERDMILLWAKCRLTACHILSKQWISWCFICLCPSVVLFTVNF